MSAESSRGVLRNATLIDGLRVDVELAGARVERLLPPWTAQPVTDGGTDVDLTGYLLLGAPAEPHSHLDKARSWTAIRPPMGDLLSAIAAWKVHAAGMSESEVAGRAREQLLAMVAAGTTAVRSHVDLLDGPDPLRGVRALVQVRADLADLVDLELVGLAGPVTPTAVIDAALDAGIDTVGGVPHLADDPLAELDRLLAIAQRREVPVDLHTDESLDGPVTLLAYARAVTGRPGNFTAGHCVRLGTVDAAERDVIVDAVLAARIGVVANPITNLYLQGWDEEVPTSRGLAPARVLLDAGVRFAAGADNVQDPFNPLGRSDALETAMLLVVAAHLTVTEAYAAVSSGAREVMGLPAAGPGPGLLADLLAVRAGSLEQAVAQAPADRVVVRRGRVVCRTRTEREFFDSTSGLNPAAAGGGVASAEPRGQR